MVEPEASIDSLIAALRRQMNDAFPATYVPDREQLGRDPMDPIVGRYLEEELDRRVEQELARLAYDPSDWISGERREFVDRAHRNLRTSIATAVSFPSSRWEALVGRAAAASCSFVMKPASTLVDEVFQLRADAVPAATARSRVRALAGHPALTERVDVWLAGSDDPIRRTAFVNTVKSILEEIIVREDDWVRVAEPLFALHQRVNGQRVVPSERLEALYTDLALDGVAERIAELAKDSKAALWNEGMLVHALSAGGDDFAFGNETEEQTAEPELPRFEFIDTEEEVEMTADLFSNQTNPDADSDHLERVAVVAADLSAAAAESKEPESDSPTTDGQAGEKADDPVPLWMKFQSKINAPMSPRGSEIGGGSSRSIAGKGGRGSPAAESRPATSNPAVEKSNRPLWERYRKPESRAEISTDAPAEFHEVEVYVLGDLDTSQRQAYIETLFNGRTSEYREMIYSLAEIETWSEATTAIADEVFRRNRVNIYSEVAIEFTNAVEKRYKR